MDREGSEEDQDDRQHARRRERRARVGGTQLIGSRMRTAGLALPLHFRRPITLSPRNDQSLVDPSRLLPAHQLSALGAPGVITIPLLDRARSGRFAIRKFRGRVRTSVSFSLSLSLSLFVSLVAPLRAQCCSSHGISVSSRYLG